MEPKEHQPPRIALLFFRWYCHSDYREEIEGDLIERFHHDLKQYGPNKAKRRFLKEVLLLFRPRFIKSIIQLTNNNSKMMSTQNKSISQKLKWSRALSIVVTLLGVLLLIYMITVEGEPGGIPLLLILVGLIWFFVNQYQIKQSSR